MSNNSHMGPNAASSRTMDDAARTNSSDRMLHRLETGTKMSPASSARRSKRSCRQTMDFCAGACSGKPHGRHGGDKRSRSASSGQAASRAPGGATGGAGPRDDEAAAEVAPGGTATAPEFRQRPNAFRRHSNPTAAACGDQAQRAARLPRHAAEARAEWHAAGHRCIHMPFLNLSERICGQGHLLLRAVCGEWLWLRVLRFEIH